jgi:uncharacterized membrane protein
MPHIERQTTISAPVEKVFAYLADFSRHREWAVHDLEVGDIGQGPVAAGTTFRSRGRMWGLNINNENVVTEFVPNECIAFESVSPGGRFRNAFSLREEGDRTLLVKQVDVVRPRVLLSPLVRLGFPLVAGRRLNQDLQRIKARLEESSG